MRTSTPNFSGNVKSKQSGFPANAVETVDKVLLEFSIGSRKIAPVVGDKQETKSFEHRKDKKQLYNEMNMVCQKLNRSKNADFIECIENLERLKESFDIFTQSFYCLLVNRIGVEDSPESVNLDGTDGKPSQTFNQGPESINSVLVGCDVEEMEDHSRENELGRLNDMEEKLCLCKEEYAKAKQNAELYKRRPVSYVEVLEEIPEEVRQEEPPFWNFTEEDWKKRVAYEKSMTGVDCRKFGK